MLLQVGGRRGQEGAPHKGRLVRVRSLSSGMAGTYQVDDLTSADQAMTGMRLHFWESQNHH